MSSSQSQPNAYKLPRVAISFCTQCRWMLRAAYFGQELLSTFNTKIGEIALIPATGGLFEVKLTYQPLSASGESGEVQEVLLWDRKSEGGFPETKVLKQKLRDYIEPERNLGHSDNKAHVSASQSKQETQLVSDSSEEVPRAEQDATDMSMPATTTIGCEDCK
ncbi:seleno protein domain-containing protein [Delphinella strobiligena]|nr:seleno protein domain-containing protein [Delphinella strobiligena]